MSDMPVCLVTPRSSTQTKAGPTPFWSDGPKWPAETLRRDGAPGLKAESAPPDLLSKRSLLSPVLLLLLLKTQCPFNPSSIPSLATPNLQSTPPSFPLRNTHTHTFPFSFLNFPVSEPLMLTLARHLLASHHPDRPVPPPTSVAFSMGVYFTPRWLDRLWVISQGGG